MYSTETLIELLRKNGNKITPQRRKILELLSNDPSHPTADEVYRRVQAVMPDVSRTTVYNTLREMVEVGILAPVEDVSENGMRYDTNVDRHHHLYCLSCHQLIDISRDFKELDLTEEETAGYQVIRSQVTLYGYCPQCRKAQTGTQNKISLNRPDSPRGPEV